MFVVEDVFDAGEVAPCCAPNLVVRLFVVVFAAPVATVKNVETSVGLVYYFTAAGIIDHRRSFVSTYESGNMVDITAYILAKLRQVSQLGDPTLTQSIIGIYLFYTSITIATGTFSRSEFRSVTTLAIMFLFFSYASGLVLLDDEIRDEQED